jgi:hypothetical protein
MVPEVEKNDVGQQLLRSSDAVSEVAETGERLLCVAHYNLRADVRIRIHLLLEDGETKVYYCRVNHYQPALNRNGCDCIGHNILYDHRSDFLHNSQVARKETYRY